MANRLLRASDFCRPLHAPKVQVKIGWIEKKANEAEATIYGSAKLLIQLCCKTGDVVWLSSSDDALRIPAVLCFDSEMKDANNIKVPPTMNYLAGNGWTIQACTADIHTIKQVVVRPIGRPVADDILAIDSKANEYPDIGTTARLVAPNVLLTVLQDDEIFVYQVVSDDLAFGWTCSDTEWKLQQDPAKVNIPRLPPLIAATAFLKGESCPQSLLPHPSLSDVRHLVDVPHDAPPRQLVLHVIGGQDNHVDLIVEKTAHSIGRRYLPVNGLAAYAHRTGKTVTTGSMVDKLAGLTSALEQAQAHAPCILQLLDLDLELPVNDDEMKNMLEQRIWTMLVTFLRVKGGNRPNCVPPVVVVLSTRKPLGAGPLLQNLIFGAVMIQEPDEAYARHLWNENETFDSNSLVGHSAKEILRLKRMWLNTNDDRGIAAFFKESSTSVADKSSQIPNVYWQDVGALTHVRKEVMDAIEIPLKHAHLFKNTRRSGLLLYGPPGTGKTLVAKAVATECGLPFLSVKGPELLGSYVGESEENVRELFDKAREAASKHQAAILFFDELDSLAPRRGGLGDGGGVMERVVATLLTELDKPSTVFLIAATNRPDLIDPSLMRPGRLDRRVYLGLPSKSQDRAQILAALIRKFKLERNQTPLDFALQVVDDFPENLSGADFAAIASGALRLSLKRLCDAANRQVTPEHDLTAVLEGWDDAVPVVTKADLIAASKEISASVTQEDLLRYQRLRDDFSSTASPEDDETMAPRSPASVGSDSFKSATSQESSKRRIFKNSRQ